MIVKDNPYFNATVTRYFGLKNPIHRSVASIDEQLYKNTGKVHILGGYAYTEKSDNIIKESFALSLNPRFATKELYTAIIRYPFEDMNAEAMYATVEKSNRHALHMALRLGMIVHRIMNTEILFKITRPRAEQMICANFDRSLCDKIPNE